jgi:hypothetical protein
LLPRLILVVAALLAVVLVLRWFARLPPGQAARVLRWGLFIALLLVLVLLAATGRLNWIFALVASLAPLFRRLILLAFGNLPVLGGLYRQYRSARTRRRPSPGQTSRIDTTFLSMALDHDTGEMSGEVLAGQFKGAQLRDLDFDQLLQLMNECQAQDADSVALLEAYLDRMHADEWREQKAESKERSTPPPHSESGMTRDEALEILGLAPGASEEDIIAAHRRLMQRLHPDRGGSDWLAAKLNQAKDLLLAG